MKMLKTNYQRGISLLLLLVCVLQTQSVTAKNIDVEQLNKDRAVIVGRLLVGYTDADQMILECASDIVHWALTEEVSWNLLKHVNFRWWFLRNTYGVSFPGNYDFLMKNVQDGTELAGEIRGSDEREILVELGFTEAELASMDLVDINQNSTVEIKDHFGRIGSDVVIVLCEYKGRREVESYDFEIDKITYNTEYFTLLIQVKCNSDSILDIAYFEL